MDVPGQRKKQRPQCAKGGVCPGTEGGGRGTRAGEEAGGGRQGGSHPGRDCRGLWLTPAMGVGEGFEGWRAGMSLCDLVVALSLVEAWAAPPPPRGGLEDQHKSRLASCLANPRALLRVVGDGDPQSVPRGPAFLLGSWGRWPSLRNPWAPASPCADRALWNVWSEISSVVHGAGWGRLPGGWTLQAGWCREMPKPTSGAPREDVGSVFLRRPTSPPDHKLLPTAPLAHPYPAPGAPSSPLHPPVRPAPGTEGLSSPCPHLVLVRVSQDASD